MTNTLILPIHTWGTGNLDHELALFKPFSPDWLRTETIGLQVGNYPLSLYPVSGKKNPIIKKLPKEKRERIEWAMRAVHEIQRHGPLEKFLTDLGYRSSVVINNYWSEKPVVRADKPQVKWLALVKPEDRKLMIVLARWDEKEVEAELSVDHRNLGFTVQRLVDVESGQEFQLNPQGRDSSCGLTLPAPYGARLLTNR